MKLRFGLYLALTLASYVAGSKEAFYKNGLSWQEWTVWAAGLAVSLLTVARAFIDRTAQVAPSTDTAKPEEQKP